MNRDAEASDPTLSRQWCRLRWSLMFAAMRKSPWQVVGYVLALLMAAWHRGWGGPRRIRADRRRGGME